MGQKAGEPAWHLFRGALRWAKKVMADSFAHGRWNLKMRLWVLVADEYGVQKKPSASVGHLMMSSTCSSKGGAGCLWQVGVQGFFEVTFDFEGAKLP